MSLSCEIYPEHVLNEDLYSLRVGSLSQTFQGGGRHIYRAHETFCILEVLIECERAIDESGHPVS